MKSDVHDTTLREVERRGGKGRHVRVLCICAFAHVCKPPCLYLCMFPCVWVCVLGGASP